MKITYIYVHFFSNGDKYTGISNNPKQRWKEGFDSNNTRQYNHKVLIANEKYERKSLIVSEDLPRRIAEYMEAILIQNDVEFPLNIKEESLPDLHGNTLEYKHTPNYTHIYPEIDGEVMYYSPTLAEINNQNLNSLKWWLKIIEEKKYALLLTWNSKEILQNKEVFDHSAENKEILAEIKRLEDKYQLAEQRNAKILKKNVEKKLEQAKKKLKLKKGWEKQVTEN